MTRRPGRVPEYAPHVRRRRSLYRPRLEGLETRELLSLTPAGSEFRVNAVTTANQQSPAVASDTAGDFVVVWQSGDFTNGYDIKAQRYNPSGVAQGGEITVNSSPSGGDHFRFTPSVAMDSDGDFVVTWEYYDINGVNTTDYDIFARRFNAAGTAQGNEFRVNTTTGGTQGDASVAIDSDGDFVVTWRDSSGATPVISFQRYNAAGTAQGGEVDVDGALTSTQTLPAIGMDSSGNYAIAFAALTGTLSDTDGGIYFRRYNAAGTAQGSLTRANTTITGLQTAPAIGMAGDGVFVVSWSGNGTQAGQSDTQGVFFQRYNAAGTAQGTETRANTTTANSQQVPAVAMNPLTAALDTFTIVWGDDATDGGGRGVYGQNFTTTGAASGTQFKANTTTAGNQEGAAIATGGNGGTLITWHSPQGGTTDIWAQRYSTNLAPTANDQAVSVTLNTPKPITLTGSDPESAPLTFMVTLNPTFGMLSGTAPNLTYTPNNGYTGPDSFQFKVNDGSQDSLTPGTVTITVAASVVLQSITVTPANPNVPKGLTQQFTATGNYSDGSTQNLTNSVTWASATPANATINTTGLATAVNVGSSTISATQGAIMGSTVMNVIAPVLQSIAVTPANPSVPKGLTQQFTATGTFSDSSTQNLTSTVTWSSGTPAVATINTSGLATAVNTGTSTISATQGAINGSTVMTVTAPILQSIAVTPANPSVTAGQTQQFTATGTFSDSSTQNLTSTVTWSSGTPSVATINTSGLATAVSPGTSTISATQGAINGSTVLTVNAPIVNVTQTTVGWGGQTSAALVTQGDGLRLLPAGRTTSIPWLDINKIGITLSGASSLAPGDVSVVGSVGGNYGPVMISGGGSSYTIMLNTPIAVGDRVTVIIGNPTITSYTRRLDVLPGDVNDDGVVNSTDAAIARAAALGSPVPVALVFIDINGDGLVDMNDFNHVRARSGRTLPPP